LNFIKTTGRITMRGKQQQAANMGWALAAVFLAVVVLMASNSARKLPWKDKMRRLREGGDLADWMAPEGVVQHVTRDYLNAVEWMQNSPSLPWTHQWRSATAVFAGGFLRRYQQLLLRQRSERGNLFYGVLRADHDIDVRGFSADGLRCWLIDRQQGRRIATYSHEHHERVTTQDLGDGAVVMQLLYHPEEDCWKIEALIQELPPGWQQRKKLHISPEHTDYPRRIGRDH
jgi:hypothetical protein